MSRPAARRRSALPQAAEVCEPRRLLTTFVVTDGGDVSDETDGVLTYREALLAAEASAGADVVTFAEGVTSVTLAADLPALADDLTVAGGGVTVDHAGFAGLTLSGGAFALSDLRLTGGDAFAGGALRLAGGADVTLEDVSFADNFADDGGGAVDVAGGSTLTVSGGKFERNYARGYDRLYFGSTLEEGGEGGAVRVSDGGSAAFAGTVFDRNAAETGGAVFVTSGPYGQYVSVELTDVRATRNLAGLRGGPGGTLTDDGEGGFLKSDIEDDEDVYPDVVVTGGRFTLNAATGWGGAFDISKGLLDVEGAVFSTNSAVRGGGAAYAFGRAVFEDSVFFRNAAGPDPAAVLALAGPGADASALVADGGSGGAIMKGRGYALRVAGSTFTQNAAARHGGAIYGSGRALIVTLTDVRMFKNAAGLNGGAADLGFGVAATVVGGRYAQNVAGGSGGAFHLDINVDLTLRDLSANRNVARGDGGGIRGGGVAYVRANASGSGTRASLTVDGVFAARNRAGGGASGGAILAADADVTVVDSNFAGNAAGRSGGNVALYGGTAAFAGSFLRGGGATHGGGLLVAEGLRGTRGAAAAVTFAGGGLIGNEAAGRGGAVRVNAGVRPAEANAVTLDGTRVRGNRAAEGGAAFVQRADRGVGRLAVAGRSVFRGNRAAETGGAFAVGGELEVGGRARFAGNAARGSGHVAFVFDGGRAAVADALFRGAGPDDFAGPGRLRRT